MVAQVQVFIHVVFNNKGLVAVQTAPPTVRVQQRGERTQVVFPEGRDKAIVKAQFIQEDLEERENEKNIMYKKDLWMEPSWLIPPTFFPLYILQ